MSELDLGMGREFHIKTIASHFLTRELSNKFIKQIKLRAILWFAINSRVSRIIYLNIMIFKENNVKINIFANTLKKYLIFFIVYYNLFWPSLKISLDET